MAYDAVIFDLDGTLLDTLEDLSDGANAVLSGFGFPAHPTQAYRLMVGRGLRILVTEALPEQERSDEMIRRMQDALGEHLRAHPVTKTRPYPGIPELLSALERRGVPMSICTNKPDALTHLVVEKLLAAWRFVGVQGQRDGLPRKPDPAGALALSREMGRPPQTTLFLGDSDVDMETAIAAGMRPIGAAWGFRGAEELRSAGADRVVSDPLDLLELLDEA